MWKAPTLAMSTSRCGMVASLPWPLAPLHILPAGHLGRTAHQEAWMDLLWVFCAGSQRMQDLSKHAGARRRVQCGGLQPRYLPGLPPKPHLLGGAFIPLHVRTHLDEVLAACPLFTGKTYGMLVTFTCSELPLGCAWSIFR